MGTIVPATGVEATTNREVWALRSRSASRVAHRVAGVPGEGTIAGMDSDQLVVSAGFPAACGAAVVVFDRALQHTNSFSVIVRIMEGERSREIEMFRGDELEVGGSDGRWVLTGLRDAIGAGVYRPDGSLPVTAVFRRQRQGEVGFD